MFAMRHQQWRRMARRTRSLAFGLALAGALTLPVQARAQCVDGDCINGSGTKITRGHKYTGEFRDNHRHGFGVYEFPNGDVYQGEFVEGDMEGKGTYQYANGDVYEGAFKDNQPDGVGEFRYQDGTRVRGVFHQGILVGPGQEVVSEELPDSDSSQTSGTDSVGVRAWGSGGSAIMGD